MSNKKRNKKFEFDLYNNGVDERIVFVFHAKDSSVHGFGDEPPKSWDQVYKVYYYYSVFQETKAGEWNDKDTCKKLFGAWDECSRIDDLSACLKEVVQKDGNIGAIEILSLGGINFLVIGGDGDKNADNSDPYSCPRRFQIYMTKQDNTGYMIYLNEKQALEFANFIDSFCEYMLEHSQGI